MGSKVEEPETLRVGPLLEAAWAEPRGEERKEAPIRPWAKTKAKAKAKIAKTLAKEGQALAKKRFFKLAEILEKNLPLRLLSEKDKPKLLDVAFAWLGSGGNKYSLKI
jgi:hypothetical protein